MAKLTDRTKSRPKGTRNVKPVNLSMYKPQPQHILLTETLSAEERTHTISLSRLYPSLPAEELHATTHTLNILLLVYPRF
jgi:hypothetical protein